MKPEHFTTYGRMFAGQPAPNPIAPPGDGWDLIQTTPGHDPEGKPALVWTWRKMVLEQGEAEELTQ